MRGVMLGAAAAAVFGASALLHQRALKREAASLRPSGRMVTVNGHRMHVAAEGKRDSGLTLVFLSGSGTGAPAYDFAPLYRLLSGEYRVAVPERAGYGYSEIAEVPRGISLVLEETREALRKAGERPPYVLFPHSMSGLEAIYWAQRYPEEVAGIIGLDMALPEYYQMVKIPVSLFYIPRFLCLLGIQRLPLVEKQGPKELTLSESRQYAKLVIRNCLNRDILWEGKALAANAGLVGKGGDPRQPVLLFSSHGREVGKKWLLCQKAFALRTGSRLEVLDCGHYLHRFQPERIARESRAFLKTLQPG